MRVLHDRGSSFQNHPSCQWKVNTVGPTVGQNVCNSIRAQKSDYNLQFAYYMRYFWGAGT